MKSSKGAVEKTEIQKPQGSQISDSYWYNSKNAKHLITVF
jgi:hypothetical protein